MVRPMGDWGSGMSVANLRLRGGSSQRDSQPVQYPENSWVISGTGARLRGVATGSGLAEYDDGELAAWLAYFLTRRGGSSGFGRSKNLLSALAHSAIRPPEIANATPETIPIIRSVPERSTIVLIPMRKNPMTIIPRARLNRWRLPRTRSASTPLASSRWRCRNRSNQLLIGLAQRSLCESDSCV